jgi:hypothetical protein
MGAAMRAPRYGGQQFAHGLRLHIGHIAERDQPACCRAAAAQRQRQGSGHAIVSIITD